MLEWHNVWWAPYFFIFFILIVLFQFVTPHIIFCLERGGAIVQIIIIITGLVHRVCGKLSKRRGGRRRGRCVYYFVSIIITYGGFFSVSFFSFFSFPLPALFPPWSGCSGRLFFFSVGLLPQHILGGKQGSIQQGRVVVLLELQRFNILFQFSHGSCFREAQK
ncbi:hypothetical protein P167DRAFT_85963 [Morchella conica CCBAS932]|uniref:Transmembrane protein n=1 Tax=Morchella conica CCBAS932 TaxID=1392247 RepID=A0A3N4KTP6_9PEZI|nr:hypothetical protein P167DRAFT_85963 [Morchella conica CCBAS932]